VGDTEMDKSMIRHDYRIRPQEPSLEPPDDEEDEKALDRVRIAEEQLEDQTDYKDYDFPCGY
jgi:hypothetical protein